MAKVSGRFKLCLVVPSLLQIPLEGQMTKVSGRFKLYLVVQSLLQIPWEGFPVGLYFLIGIQIAQVNWSIFIALVGQSGQQ